MVLPTTVLPPTVDELDIQALTNVPMPNVQPAPPRVSPYSRTNLPEFMRQRVEVAPGLFGPQQGLLGAAPVGAPADYGALEQQFVESFAARPEYFGRSYTPGAMMPGGLEFAPMSAGQPFSFEEGLKTAATLQAAYNLREPVGDLLKSFQEGVVDPFASGFDDTVIEPIKETLEPIASGIDDYLVEPVKETLEPVGDFIGNINVPGVQAAKDFVGPIASGVDDLIIEPIKEAVEGFLPEGVKTKLPGGTETIGNVLDTVGDVENLFAKPHVDSYFKAVESAQVAAGDAFIPGDVLNAGADAAAALGIKNFIENPTVQDAIPALNDAAYLAQNYAPELYNSLPGAEQLSVLEGPLAVFNAAEALKGGIDSPGELASVVSGVSSLTGIGAGIVNPAVSAALLVTSLPDMLEGGAAGEIPRSYRTLGFEDGNLGVLDARKIDKAKSPTEVGKREFVPEQTENAMDFVNWLQNSMGYQVDQTALKKWEASDQDQIVDQYGYFEQRHKLEDPSVNAADFVTNMLQAGVLKPTAETPAINMQEALSVLNPETTYYSDLQDIQVAGNVNVPYLLSQINPYPEGFDQETGKKLTPQQIEQRQKAEQAAQAYIEREPTPPQTIAEFIGPITPQQAMALPAGFDLGQAMPNFMPDLSGLVTIPGGYNPAVRQQAYSIDKGLYDFNQLLRTLPI
jgi:hypothetical protein